MQLAQVNVAEAVAPLDSPTLRGFVRAAGPLDALARRSPGFVWRPDPREVDLADLAVFGDPMLVVPNLTVWESLDALLAYVYDSGHAGALKRARSWFKPPTQAQIALWWVADGERPTLAEAHRRLELLRTNGPTPQAFPLDQVFPPE